jgi:hypothetical protein
MTDTGKVNIHGKQYLTVAYRINEFRKDHADWSIVSELISADEAVVLMQSKIIDETGRVLATGYAEENRTASKINQTSAVENAETSSVGRALAFLGYGGTEIASADEVANAIKAQAAIEQIKKDPKVIKRIQAADSMAQLQEVWKSLSKVEQHTYAKDKDDQKTKLQEAA